MSYPVETTIDSDVEFLRQSLGEMGNQQNIVVTDEVQYVVNDPSGSGTIVTDFPISVVNGAWLLTDPTFSGTNYVLDGTFDPFQSKIYLGTNPGIMQRLYISYVRSNGLLESRLTNLYESAKLYLEYDMGTGSTYTFSLSDNSNINKLATYTALAIAAYWAVLELNTGNMIQAGYSFRLRDYDVQTKLWGEGMSAEALFMRFWQRATLLLEVLKRTSGDWIYIVDLGQQSASYIDQNILGSIASTFGSLEVSDWTSYEEIKGHFNILWTFDGNWGTT